MTPHYHHQLRETLRPQLRRSITRACADCGEAAYPSVRYPDDIPIVCEVCTYERLLGEAGASA